MVLILIIILLWVVGIIGWVLNIVKLVKLLKSKEGENLKVTPMFIARCIGIVAAPLGSVLGFISN